MTADRHSVTLVRRIAAGRDAVYAAWTVPSIMRTWFGSKVEAEVRVGGRYRIENRAASTDGSEFGFAGTFREVTPPSRLVHTETYDPGTVGDVHPKNEALVSVTFTEDNGITTVTTLIDFGSKETRDAAVATGMTDGMEQSYQLLDALLSEPV